MANSNTQTLSIGGGHDAYKHSDGERFHELVNRHTVNYHKSVYIYIYLRTAFFILLK